MKIHFKRLNNFSGDFEIKNLTLYYKDVTKTFYNYIWIEYYIKHKLCRIKYTHPFQNNNNLIYIKMDFNIEKIKRFMNKLLKSKIQNENTYKTR